MKMTFEQWLAKQGISKAKFCRDCGVNNRSLNAWLSGDTEPIISTFIPFVEHVLKLDPEANAMSFFPFKKSKINPEKSLK